MSYEDLLAYLPAGEGPEIRACDEYRMLDQYRQAVSRETYQIRASDNEPRRVPRHAGPTRSEVCFGDASSSGQEEVGSRGGLSLTDRRIPPPLRPATSAPRLQLCSLSRRSAHRAIDPEALAPSPAPPGVRVAGLTARGARPPQAANEPRRRNERARRWIRRGAAKEGVSEGAAGEQTEALALAGPRVRPHLVSPRPSSALFHVKQLPFSPPLEHSDD